MGVVSAMIAAVLTAGALAAPAAPAAVPDFSTAEAGNPFVDGWYADPDVAVYEGRYWVFPTSSRPYNEQTYLDAFSSTDLVHWTKHPNVLTVANVSWARRAVWAPAPVQRNGKYYLYFGANDIQSNSELGGIGVAVADRPEGPYVDAIGAPLIGQFVNGAQPIDQDVFVDDDGQAYLYYGGWQHANVVKLNSDMTSLGRFADGSTYKEITPANYTEGSQVFKRNGKYYLMWSEGYWGGSDYSVSYAMADSPTGPFTKIAKILTQDSEVAKGSGHNAVLNVPGTDIWYIVYHRRPLSETDANHRQLAYDRMSFNADGTIRPVTMKVRDNFEDGNAYGWKAYGSTWSATDGTYRATASPGGKSLQDTNFATLTYDADVTITAGTGDAGVIFRATQPATGTDAYRGYYAGLTTTGRVILGKADNNWRQLATAAFPVTRGTRYHLRIEATGTTIKVYADSTLKLTVTDSTFTTGATGVRVFNTAAAFDNIAID
ncbi:family 43 glycosylhydrolase [Nucisporomicrobium flavum]|uniref:family 43 glycosylhydrolase n=1 Tax=Nucisporomicrobium flavum TaxID=2785915 RepID=UPI003C2BBE57